MWQCVFTGGAGFIGSNLARTSVQDSVSRLVAWIKNNERLFDAAQASQRAMRAGAGL